MIEAELGDEHDPVAHHVSMRDLQRRIGADGKASLAFTAAGGRPTFFTARLEVQRPAAGQPAVSHGLTVTRRYEMRRGDTWTPVTTVTAGDVVRITLTIKSDEARFLVALSDPLPAGFEAIDLELPSTASALRADAPTWWGVFDHVQRRDSRLDAFATFLPVHQTTFEVHRACHDGGDLLRRASARRGDVPAGRLRPRHRRDDRRQAGAVIASLL